MNKPKANKRELRKATEAAKRVLEMKTQIKELKKQVEEDMELVRDFSIKTGHRRFDNVEAYERANPAKIKLPIGMSEEDFRKALQEADLWKYTDNVINSKLIIECIEEDEKLQELMEEYEIEIVQESALHLKHF